MTIKTSRDIEVVDVYYKQHNDKVPAFDQDLYFPAVVTLNSSVNQLTGNVAGWKQLLARHINATTNREGTLVKAYRIRGYMQLRVTNGADLPYENPDHSSTQYDWYGALLVAGVPAIAGLASTAKAETLAAEQFLKQARNALSSFQGGVFLGELKEAIHGIRHPAESLVDFLKHHVSEAKTLRRRLRGHGAGSRTLNKVISDLWLEKSYHWLPLVGDLENAAQSLARLSSLEDAKMVSAEGFDDYTSEGSDSLNQRGPFGLRYAVRYIENARVRFYGQVVAFNDENPGAFSDLLRTRLGLTLSEAAPTAWELIPFSFVADYFSNLGTVIAAYSFPTAAIRWMNRGVLSKATNLVVNPRLNQNSSTASQKYEYLINNPGSFKATNQYFLRTPYEPSDLLPSFRLAVPGVSDWPKWLNLAALANSIRS